MKKIKKIQTLFEVIINTFIGNLYCQKIIVPSLQRESKKWNRNWSGKKACLILSYDIDDSRDIQNLPKLLKLLRKYKIKAVFAAIGLLVEKNPKIFKDILTEGHEIINHTQSHPDSSEFNNTKHFHLISQKERFSEIQKCHTTVKKILKYDMKGFRIPHFGNQFIDDIYPMLKELGYIYSSSTVAIHTETEGFPYEVSGVLEFPLTCCPKHPFCIFDTSHAFRSRFARHSKKEYLLTFERYLDFGIQNNLFMNFYQDPQDIDKFDYEKILKSISDRKKDLLIVTYDGLMKKTRLHNKNFI